MKKKNLTINRLAIGNLKARKKQYTIMIIGILLSMIFSSGVLFLISCMQSSSEEFARQKTGNAFGVFYDSEGIIDPEGEFEKKFISEYGYANIVGYGYTDDEKQDKGTPIAYLDEKAKDLYYVTLKEGREPDKQGEIAVESDALSRLNIEAEIGDEIKLSVLTPDGNRFKEGAEEKTYTLVGILADKRANFEYDYGYTGDSLASKLPAAFVYSGEKVNNGGREIKVLYYNVFKEKLKQTEIVVSGDGNSSYKESLYATEFIPSYIAEYPGRVLHYLSKKTGSFNEISNGSGISLTIVLSAVLMIASCIGIVNSFSANLQERKKQIGMLRAVGATRRQIINIFGREAFIISLVCAPISVAVSYFGVKLYAHLMGDNFIFIPNFLVLFGTAVVSVICVMAAALIPLFVTSRISPMQAIRNMELSRKMKNKKIKSQSSFNTPALLAKRSLSLHRGKQISVSVLLAATILLSCFGFSFMEVEMERAKSSMINCDYMIWEFEYTWLCEGVNFPNYEKGFSENDKQDIASHHLLSEVYSFKKYEAFLNTEEYSPYMDIAYGRFRYGLPRPDFPDNTKITAENFIETWYTDKGYTGYNEFKSKTGFENEIIPTELYFYDTNIVEKHKNDFEIIDGKINMDKINSGEEIILVATEEIGHCLSINDDGLIYMDGSHDMSEPLRNDPVYNNDTIITHTAKLGYKAGDVIKISTLYSGVSKQPEIDPFFPDDVTKCDREVKIGAIVKPFSVSSVFSVPGYPEICLLSTVPAQPVLTDANLPYKNIGIDVDSEIDDETDQRIMQFLNTYVSGTAFKSRSNYEMIKRETENLKNVLIAMISIIILFFSISTAIINNTLTAKIRESKREIGTLRAVGASARELTLSYVLQMISMFLWGSAAGFGLYGIAQIVLKLILKEDWNYPFTIWQALVAIALLIVICSINLYSKVRKEMKNSIVENIREL